MKTNVRVFSVNKMLVVFAAAFVLLSAVGTVAGGSVGWPEASGLYGLFYATLPKVFSRALSLNMQGFAEFPVLTLISSFGFAVLAVHLFCSQSKADPRPLDDGALFEIAVDSVLMFPYFTLFCSVLVNPFLIDEYQSRRFVMLIPVVMLAAEIVRLFMGAKEEEGAFSCRLARILSGLSAAMATAGFVRVSQQWKIESLVLLPVKIGGGLTALAGKLDGKLLALPVVLCVLVGLTVLTVYGFLKLMDEGACISSSITWTLIPIVLLFFGEVPIFALSVCGYRMKYWVFLLLLLFLWAEMIRRNGGRYLPSLLGGWASLCGGLSLLYASHVFSPVIRSSFAVLADKLDFLAHIDMTVKSVVLIGLPVLLVTAVMIPVVLRKNDSGSTDARYAAIGCLCAWLVGVIVLGCTPERPFFRTVGSMAVIISVVAYAACLSGILLNGDRYGLGYFIRSALIFVVLTPVYVMVAKQAGILLGAVAGAVCVLSAVKGYADSKVTKSDLRGARVANAVRYNDDIDAVNEALARGADEAEARRAAMLAAQRFLAEDERLKKELDSMK